MRLHVELEFLLQNWIRDFTKKRATKSFVDSLYFHIELFISIAHLIRNKSKFIHLSIFGESVNVTLFSLYIKLQIEK